MSCVNFLQLDDDWNVKLININPALTSKDQNANEQQMDIFNFGMIVKALFPLPQSRPSYIKTLIEGCCKKPEKRMKAKQIGVLVDILKDIAQLHDRLSFLFFT